MFHERTLGFPWLPYSIGSGDATRPLHRHTLWIVFCLQISCFLLPLRCFCVFPVLVWCHTWLLWSLSLYLLALDPDSHLWQQILRRHHIIVFWSSLGRCNSVAFQPQLLVFLLFRIPFCEFCRKEYYYFNAKYFVHVSFLLFAQFSSFHCSDRP